MLFEVILGQISTKNSNWTLTLSLEESLMGIPGENVEFRIKIGNNHKELYKINL